MGFAGAWRAEQNDVAVLGEVGAGGQGLDGGAGAGLVVKVEIVQGFHRGEARGADPQSGAGGVAGGDLTLEHRGQVVLVGPAGIAGMVGQPCRGLGNSGRLERGGEMGDVFERLTRWGAAHRGLSCSGSIPNALS